MFTRLAPLIILVLALLTGSSLLQPGYFSMHDDLQIVRTQQMSFCWRDFQIPCRWVPDMGYGYGYPQFEYYGPLPYYVSSFFHSAGFSLVNSVKYTFLIALIGSGLSMYLFTSHLWGKWPGVLSSAAYILAPYRASDLFSRGAMGETFAFIFLPLIFYTLHLVIDDPTAKRKTYLGLAVAGLLTTHNITSLIFLPIVTVYALVVTRRYKPLVSSALLGLCLAAFYFFPVLWEKRFAHTESMISGYFNYLAHFVTIKQMLFSTFWGYGSSQIGPTDDLSFSLGPVHLFLALISLVVAIRQKKIKPILFTLFFFTAIFMSHVRSSFIWDRISILAYLQFPWRFLVIAVFFSCLITGYSLTILSQTNQPKAAIFWLTLLFLFNFAYFRPFNQFRLTDTEKLNGVSWDKQMTISIFDYLPIFAIAPPPLPASTLPKSLDNPQYSVLDFHQTSNTMQFSSISSNNATVEIPQFDFPGWKLFIDGHEFSHRHDNPLGLITYTSPAGSHSITIRLYNTPVRNLGNLLSLVSIIYVVKVLIIRRDYVKA